MDASAETKRVLSDQEIYSSMKCDGNCMSLSFCKWKPPCLINMKECSSLFQLVLAHETRNPKQILDSLTKVQFSRQYDKGVDYPREV